MDEVKETKIKEYKRRGRPKKEVITTKSIYKEPPVLETPKDGAVKMCGNCISYGFDARNRIICLVRGGTRGPTAGGSCKSFKVKSG